jgi:phosphate/sulfate permease
VTWALSLPSNSSHALVGGVVGAALILGFIALTRK